MVIDTSALLALMVSAPESDRLIAALERTPTRLVSSGTLVEVSLALLDRYGDAGDVQLDRMIQALGAVVVPVDAHQATAARDVALRFGGRRHRAALNLGDCFSSALAITSGHPLLCVGRNFAHTDVPRAEW